ncbi:MAG: SDR family NAD(P)-dependent oxidoreductase [Halobacteriaceae archaeon]
MTSPEAQAGVADVDLTGRTVLVTGGTDGIGREAALAFARLGATVGVTGRDQSKGVRVRDRLRDAGPGDAALFTADFASQAAVRDLASEVRDRFDRLDVLVNNAGGIFREPSLTEDGVERTFAVNYLAHYRLTHDLLGLLRAAPDGHVVNVSSNGHRFADADFHPRDLEDYGAFDAYNRSKLALVLFTASLARRAPDLRANALHPGFVADSNFYRRFPWPFQRLLVLLQYVPRALIRRPVVDEAGGAAAICYVAVSPETRASTGEYFEERSAIAPSEAARDRDAQERLWALSADLAGLGPDDFAPPGGR